MAEQAAPPGVDPALWMEFQELEKVVDAMHQQRTLPDEGEAAAPIWRVTLELPQEQEWALLAFQRPRADRARAR